MQCFMNSHEHRDGLRECLALQARRNGGGPSFRQASSNAELAQPVLRHNMSAGQCFKGAGRRLGSSQPLTSILACCMWSMHLQNSTMKVRTATYSSSRLAFRSSAALQACKEVAGSRVQHV